MFPISCNTSIEDEVLVVKAETQGWRPSMEDFILSRKVQGIDGEIDNIFGIFDGHGGYLVSLFCKVVFPEVFVYNIEMACREIEI